jgi:hypothetical protein
MRGFKSLSEPDSPSFLASHACDNTIAQKSTECAYCQLYTCLCDSYSAIRRCQKAESLGGHLSFSLQTGAQVYCELTYVPKGVLICHRLVSAVKLSSSVLHQVDRGKTESGRMFAGTN